jgi:hypothetical protein
MFMKPIAVSLSLILAVTAAAAAQDVGKAKPTTEIVWEAKIRGVGG